MSHGFYKRSFEIQVEARPPGLDSDGQEQLVPVMQRRICKLVERGRPPKLVAVLRGSELVAAAKSAGLSPVTVESYDKLLDAFCDSSQDFQWEVGRVFSRSTFLFWRKAQLRWNL